MKSRYWIASAVFAFLLSALAGSTASAQEPPTVLTFAASDVTDSSAVLNGSLTSLGNASSVDVSFEWGLTTSYGNETTPQTVTSTSLFNDSIGSLDPGTTYHFRAKAVGNGTAYGSDLTLTTSTNPPAVTTNAATDIGVDSATLNGDLTGMGTASSVDVSFEWGLTTSYGYETTPQTLTGTGTFSDGISSLIPGETYHFRAKAVGNDTAYGDDMMFSTDANPPVVITDGYSDLTCDSVVLFGNLTDLGSAGSVEVSFEWGLSASYGDETTPQTLTGTGAFTDSLSGLDPNRTYHFRAKAVGNGTSYGDDIVFTTLQCISLEGTGFSTSSNRLVNATLEASVIAGNRTHAEPGSSLHVVGDLTLNPGEPGEMTIDLDVYGSRVRSLCYLRQEETGKSVSLQGTWIDSDDGRYYVMLSGVVALPNPEGQVLKTTKLCFVALRTPDIDVPLPESGDFVQDLESIITRITNIIDKIWDNLIGTGFSELVSAIVSKTAVLVAALREMLGGSYVP
jgi:hypothetical protein